ncbi:MAG TPA: tRNA (adenosine(37)-N6)-threonylcarbamoyltransferase complex ATPase subunit type 1 TsaE [bacterium]|nr:tRNA (adenosine(37)-N6)-threonylcarbamoyltransferase complex ATPase subunit type 1 TsaE [bacterium]
MEYISKSEKETAEIATSIIEKYPEIRIFGLMGDLGSGKTAFVRGVAEKIGVKQNITSPTFVIMKTYEAPGRHLVHIDAYRLDNQEDLFSIGFDDLVSEPSNLVFIEWPEKVFKTIPKNIKLINFSYLDENSRKIID